MVDLPAPLPARKSWSELWRKWRRMNDEGWGLAKDRRNGRIIWLLRTLALPASALVHSPRVLLSPELDTLGQKLAALGILYRLRVTRAADALRVMVTAP